MIKGRVQRLRALLDAGYALTHHDVDGFFREAEIVRLDQMLAGQ